MMASGPLAANRKPTSAIGDMHEGEIAEEAAGDRSGTGGAPGAAEAGRSMAMRWDGDRRRCRRQGAPHHRRAARRAQSPLQDSTAASEKPKIDVRRPRGQPCKTQPSEAGNDEETHVLLARRHRSRRRHDDRRRDAGKRRLPRARPRRAAHGRQPDPHRVQGPDQLAQRGCGPSTATASPAGAMPATRTWSATRTARAAPGHCRAIASPCDRPPRSP